MLYKDNTISTSVSEAVDKIPTNEKDYRKCSYMYFTLYSHSIWHTKSNFVQRADQHITNIEIVFTQQDTSSAAKKLAEDILHKIYTKKGAITGI